MHALPVCPPGGKHQRRDATEGAGGQHPPPWLPLLTETGLRCLVCPNWPLGETTLKRIWIIWTFFFFPTAWVRAEANAYYLAWRRAVKKMGSTLPPCSSSSSAERYFPTLAGLRLLRSSYIYWFSRHSTSPSFTFLQKAWRGAALDGASGLLRSIRQHQTRRGRLLGVGFTVSDGVLGGDHGPRKDG